MDKQETLLKISGLTTQFATEQGTVTAVNAMGFKIRAYETMALVGESGCGKSVTALSIMRLIQQPPGKISSGRIEFDGVDLLTLSERRMQEIRGSRISMIFQEPMTSLNPVFTCGSQIIEAILLHRRVSRIEAEKTAIDMLARVGIPEPAIRFNEYPHQLSGGMQQRVMIAIALSCNPKLLIADEPTTALDVTIQAQILALLKELQGQGLSILLITHDLGVVAQAADMVGVMYASRLVELCDVKTLFKRPLHPYTQGLFRSLPRLGEKKHRLDAIAGNVPHPSHFPSGCAFHPRCDITQNQAKNGNAGSITQIGEADNSRSVLSRCKEQCPELLEVEPGHFCACWEALGYSQGKRTDPSDDDQPMTVIS
jgi:peptide/nickel transport system ATP-binding protein